MDLGTRRRTAEYDPQRVAAVDVADGERRVVGPDRPGTDDDRVALGPQRVGVGAGLGAGDPLAGAIGGGGPAVEGGGQLQDDPGPAGRPVLQVGGELRGDLAGGDADIDRDAGRPQAFDTAPRHPRVGIGHPHDDPGDPGGDEGIGARAGPSGVRARFERDVGGRPPAPLARRRQRGDLGVRAAGRGGGAGERLAVGGDEHAADPRVRRGEGADAPGRSHGCAHRLDVVHPGPLPAGRARDGRSRTHLAPIRTHHTLRVEHRRPWNSTRSALAREPGFADCDRRSGLAPNDPARGICRLSELSLDRPV
jgi:hypothetical protein